MAARHAVRLALIVVAGAAACGGGGGHHADGGGGGDDDAAGSGSAISAPANTWTYVPFANTTCGDGSPAGIGINPSPGTTAGILVYFEGGGACWDATTCFVIQSAANIQAPYTATSFASDIGTLGTSPSFDRTDQTNPFRDATFVFVPYCTGDLHAGSNVMTYTASGQSKTVHHTGASNTQAFIDSLRATYPSASTVWVTGSSAGGYGATLDFHEFAGAWPHAAIELLQDSGLFIDVQANYGTWQSSWKLQYPPDCTGCTTSFPAVVDSVTAAYPASRIGLLTYDNDNVIETFFGYSTATGSITTELNNLLANQYSHATTHAFVLAGNSHTMLGSEASLAGAGGVALKTWIAQWATGDAAWATVR